MDPVLDRMFEDLEAALVKEIPEYFVKVFQVKKSFYVLFRKQRGKVLGRKKEKLFDSIKNISKNIYYNYARDCSMLIFSPFLSW